MQGIKPGRRHRDSVLKRQRTPLLTAGLLIWTTDKGNLWFLHQLKIRRRALLLKSKRRDLENTFTGLNGRGTSHFLHPTRKHAFVPVANMSGRWVCLSEQPSTLTALVQGQAALLSFPYHHVIPLMSLDRFAHHILDGSHRQFFCSFCIEIKSQHFTPSHQKGLLQTALCMGWAKAR